MASKSNKETKSNFDAHNLVQLYRTAAPVEAVSYQYPPSSVLNTYEQAVESLRKSEAASLFTEFRKHLIAYDIKADAVKYSYNDFAILFHVSLLEKDSGDRLQKLRVDFEVRLGCPVEIMCIDDFKAIVAAKRLNRPVYPIKKIVESALFKSATHILPIAMGVNLMGGDYIVDLAEVSNMLVIGTTGSGKSTFINSLILSLLYRYSPDELQLVLLDPKSVDLQPYSQLPHTALGVIANPRDQFSAISWALAEAHARQEYIQKSGFSNFREYNKRASKKLPRIVVVVDEFSEMLNFDVDESAPLERLIRQIVSRTERSGVHLILASQRPHYKVVSAEIKKLVPCRASFTVVDRRESHMTIRQIGAERLLGAGDMIYSKGVNERPVHIQAPYVSPEEADRVVQFIMTNTKKNGAPHCRFLLEPELIPYHYIKHHIE